MFVPTFVGFGGSNNVFVGDDFGDSALEPLLDAFAHLVICYYGLFGVGRFAWEQRRLRVHCSDGGLYRLCIVEFALQAAFCLLALRLCTKNVRPHTT